jgi:hypothetical protein
VQLSIAQGWIFTYHVLHCLDFDSVAGKALKMGRTRISIISLCLISMIQPAYADVSEHDLYGALCVTELSIRFRWDGSRWQQHTVVANDKYIIQKLDPSSPLAEICEGEIEPITRASVIMSKSCYVLSVVGQEPNASDASTCEESWEEVGSTLKLKSVWCGRGGNPKYSFQPNGEFKEFGWMEEKDDKVISVGKCSVVRE